jgi:inosine-uridine nucleoside N-ribohydrolase
MPLRHTLIVLLIATLSTATQSAETARRKVIIDDDGFGLMHAMLLESREVEVLGFTTVSGNAWANRITATTLRTLENLGRGKVPVAQGATFPLVNSEALTDRWEALYGKLTWKGAWMKQWVEATQQSAPRYYGPDDPVELPGGNPTIKALDETAAAFLIRQVRAHPGEITLIATGPMTNLALAQRLDPQFAGLAKELIYMGGSFNPRQMLDNQSAAEFAREFANTPRREFNMRFDPEAASIMSRSPWRRIVVVPVDPSTATQLTPKLLTRLTKAARPEVAKFISAQEAGFPLWDEIAAGVFLDPGIITSRRTLFVDYDTQFGPGYGDTLSWSAGYEPKLGEQRAEVVLAIDPAKLEALMVRAVGDGAR